MRLQKGLLAIGFLIIFSSFVCADDLIVNSKDWKDVYSGMTYGFLTGYTPNFLTSEAHSTLMLNGIRKENNIQIFSSNKRPFAFGYESTVKAMGFQNVNEVKFDSLSLELAKRLPNVTKYILIDDSYGYNSVSVAPYAMNTNSYVIFADKTNIVEIDDFFSQKNPSSILIYGHVDREVTTALKKYNPEIINIDGDRFANNIEIVKKYMQIKPVGQVILTNGEFIEANLLDGEYPNLFIGKNNIPQKVKDFVASSTINTGVLIGNDLVTTATSIKRQLGISVFVKFARSARTTSGPIAQVEDLDIFAIPRVALNLSITAVRYNQATRDIEITYRNNAEVVTYFKGTYTLTQSTGEQSFGDLDPVFIGPQSYKTVAHPLDDAFDIQTAQLNVYSVFGESKESLEFVISGKYPISAVSFTDDTDITITNAYYDKANQRFVVVIKNTGTKDVYADAEIVDLLIQGERQTVTSPTVVMMKPGQSKKEYIPVAMDEGDFQSNPEIRVRVFYGEREDALVKAKEQMFKLTIQTATWVTYLPTVLIIILAILILLSLTKKKCQTCGKKNHKFRKNCKSCGNDLK